MAAGNETSDNDPPGNEPRQTPYRDLLAERRARRSVEPDDSALTNRAETAEATVRTLQAHVAGLQLRLQDATEEHQRTSEQLTACEHELGEVKQRESAEQQLRVEAEDRRDRLQLEQRAEIDRLQSHLSTSQRHASELSDRLEDVQRELLAAEQSVSTERALVRRAEQELELRLAELERRAVEIHREVESERLAREGLEQKLDSVRRSHLRMELIVGELKRMAAQLRAAGGRGPVQEEERREAMTEALAGAAERLRARVADTGNADAYVRDAQSEASAPPPEQPTAAVEGQSTAPVEQNPTAAVEGQSTAPVEENPAAAAQEPLPHKHRLPHKHSMSLLTRWRIRRKRRRKQRLERRAAAAEPPTMQS